MKEKLVNELAKDGPIDFDLFLSEEALKVIPELLDELLQEWKEEEQKFIDKINEETEFDEYVKGHPFSYLWQILYYLDSIYTNKTLRQIISDFRPKLNDFVDYLAYSKDYYEKILRLRENKNLNADQKRILDLDIKKYQQRGINLPEETQTKIKDINQKLSKIQENIRNNIVDDRAEFYYEFENDDSLKEMPTSLLEKMKSIWKNGKYGVNAERSLLFSILDYCSDPKIRKYLYNRRNSVASKGKYDNRKNIQTFFSLSQEKAHLLGYKNAWEMHLWDTMAQHPENAKQCIENIQKNARQKAEKENSFLKETYHLEHLEQSDIAYYTRKYKQERYHIDEEQLKVYFEFEHVLSYLHNFVKDAFGIELRLLDHSSSFGERWYEVWKNDKLIAYYYLDAFYRTGKKPWAWANILKEKENQKIPCIYNVCNFQTSINGINLLNRDEVETLFHEFWHAVHAIVNESSYSQLSSFEVERDFVEVPSQMMEFWTTERESLSKLAKHYQTWESLSEDVLDKLDELKTFMKGNRVLRQNELALVDNYLFTHDLPDTLEEMDEKILEVVNENSVLPKSDDYKMYCSFLHIYGSYPCKYYSYMRAEMYLNDMFQKIKEIWMFNKDILKEYCDKILSPWARKPAEELFRDFMGREVDPTALLKKYGLV